MARCPDDRGDASCHRNSRNATRKLVGPGGPHRMARLFLSHGGVSDLVQHLSLASVSGIRQKPAQAVSHEVQPAKPAVSEKRPPFGWLLLGLAFGIVVGHWVAYGLSPPGSRSNYALIRVELAFLGSLIGAVCEPLLKRFSLRYAWALWFVFAIAYWVFIGFELVMAPMEVTP